MGVFPCRGLGAPCQRAPGSITSDVRFGVKLGGYEMMADTWVKAVTASGSVSLLPRRRLSRFSHGWQLHTRREFGPAVMPSQGFDNRSSRVYQGKRIAMFDHAVVPVGGSVEIQRQQVVDHATPEGYRRIAMMSCLARAFSSRCQRAAASHPAVIVQGAS